MTEETAMFALTEEQDLLRKTARDFLEKRSDTDTVRDLMDTDDGFDAAVWTELANMGWLGMAIPTEHGGAGYGFVELGILFEEAGRALLCAPMLSSVVLGAGAVELAGSETQRGEILPAVAAGERRLALAYREAGARTARRDGDGWRLDGEADVVVDGHSADQLVVTATVDGEDVLFLVDGDADGLDRERLDSLDQTRKLAHLSFDGVVAERMPGDASAAVDEVLRRGVAMLSCEQVGGAQRVLDMAVEYAKTRTQFGRKIGSFQAIKHGCAELLVQTESAKSVAYHAARTLAAGDEEELAVAIPMAGSYPAEVFERASGDNIQIHGGIGFTWEHDAHLWFKRAKSSKVLLGSPREWRRRLAEALDL